MKYDIIKSFKGSPDGCFAVQYNEGDKGVELTDSLAEVALKEKWVKLSKSEKEKAKAEAEAEEKARLEEEARIKAEAAQREAAIAALQAELAQLGVDYDAAKTDEAKAKILADAKAKQEELEALQAK